MNPPKTLSTIGYEGKTIDEFLAELGDAGVELLIDVRAVAASRRPGFSKSALRAALAERGIDYLHLRALGTPKPGRDAARKGRVAEMHAIYEEQLQTPEAELWRWRRPMRLRRSGTRSCSASRRMCIAATARLWPSASPSAAASRSATCELSPQAVGRSAWP